MYNIHIHIFLMYVCIHIQVTSGLLSAVSWFIYIYIYTYVIYIFSYIYMYIYILHIQVTNGLLSAVSWFLALEESNRNAAPLGTGTYVCVCIHTHRERERDTHNAEPLDTGTYECVCICIYKETHTHSLSLSLSLSHTHTHTCTPIGITFIIEGAHEFSCGSPTLRRLLPYMLDPQVVFLSISIARPPGCISSLIYFANFF